MSSWWWTGILGREEPQGNTNGSPKWRPEREERNEVEQRFQNDPRYQILLITVQPLGEQLEAIQAEDKRVGL